MTLENKNVVISGCSRGIGLSIAELFSKNRANIVVNSRNLEDLKNATSHLPNCYRIAADVTNAHQAQSLIQQAHKSLGTMDIIVCNVGSGRSLPPGAETIAEWNKMFSINFFSAINMIEASKTFLKPGASIVCVSSICGLEAIEGAPIAYSTAKAALNNYVNFISRYFGKRGIRINVVTPGNVLFPSSVWDEKLTSDPVKTRTVIENEVPLSNFASTNDVAEAVLWLASEKSKFTTGSNIIVDGGQTRSI